MLRCPFCDADLGGESNRLRGGRCPKCSSILSWGRRRVASRRGSGEQAVAAGFAAAGSSAEDDGMSMKDIVRTIVQRALPRRTIRRRRTRSRGRSIWAIRRSSSVRRRRCRGRCLRIRHRRSCGMRNVAEGDGEPELHAMWRGSLTVAVRPSMTLKRQGGRAGPGDFGLADSPLPDRAARRPVVDRRRLRAARRHRRGRHGRRVRGPSVVDRPHGRREDARGRSPQEREQRDKFISEAVVTGELDHPNIVPIYDLGSNDEGALFYSMKRVRGTPWDKVIQREVARREPEHSAARGRRGGVRPRRRRDPSRPEARERHARRLRRSAGDGLGPRPSARSSQARPRLPADSLGGTPAYMAPEMATGPVEKINKTSDVYLLGAMLYEIIGGQPPHSGNDVMACLYAAAKNEIQPTDKTRRADRHRPQGDGHEAEQPVRSVQDFQAAIREYQSHSESIVLSNRADEELSSGAEDGRLPGLCPGPVRLPGGPVAVVGERAGENGRARGALAYASTALKKEDYDLGVSLLDERHAEQARLRKKLVAAQRERPAAGPHQGPAADRRRPGRVDYRHADRRSRVHHAAVPDDRRDQFAANDRKNPHRAAQQEPADEPDEAR